MAPALEPGDYLMATSWLPVGEGDLVVLEHPRRPRFWLVKRVELISGDRAWVLSDDQDITRADSRSFGPVPVETLYRVIIRYWPPGRITVWASRQ